MALAVLACAAGLVAGVRSGPLWLDETLSVEIARLPLPELYAGLRQDGAPPVYYLLLKAWMAVVGTGTVAVRLLTVAFVPVALLLAHRLGGRLGGVAGARASVIVLAALPWTMRYGSETRMYLLVVVLSLLGALLLLVVRTSPSRRAVVALGVVAGTLLLTHYWSLFLLTAVGLVHLPGLLRRRPEAVRVVVALVLGGLLFLPWAPTFLFQAAHTGAPWAAPLTVLEGLRTPRYWGGGNVHERTVLTALTIPLSLWAAVRVPRARMTGGVALLTLLLAWTAVYFGGGAYTGRYTAVIVPLVAVTVALGAVALPGRVPAVVALALLTVIGAVTGIPAAANPRTDAADAIAAFRAAGGTDGALIAYCPDQLGPAMHRLLGDGVEQVVYPTLGDPRRIDWVDYEQRQDAASPTRFARALEQRAGSRPVYLLSSPDYRTFEGQCQAVRRTLAELRGAPQVLYGDVDQGQVLYRFR